MPRGDENKRCEWWAGLGWEPGRSRLFASNEQNLGRPVKVSTWFPAE